MKLKICLWMAALVLCNGFGSSPIAIRLFSTPDLHAQTLSRGFIQSDVFRLVDADGRIRAVLGLSDTTGQPQLVMYDQKGRPGCILGINADGRGFFWTGPTAPQTTPKAQPRGAIILRPLRIIDKTQSPSGLLDHGREGGFALSFLSL